MYKLFTLIALILSITLAADPPLVIGIAGGTGSGKTTLAKKIQASLEPNVVLLEQDCYYKDLSHLPLAVRHEANFDHPGAIDFERMVQDILALKSGIAIEKPIYDFVTHTRQAGTKTVQPASVIIVEGILVLADQNIRDTFDLKIHVETDDDVRVIRRIERDSAERGRDFESIKHQYLKTVKPMHVQYVETSKQYADVIIPGASDTSAVVNLILSGLKNR